MAGNVFIRGIVTSFRTHFLRSMGWLLDKIRKKEKRKREKIHNFTPLCIFNYPIMEQKKEAILKASVKLSVLI